MLKPTDDEGFDESFVWTTIVVRWTMQRVPDTPLLCGGVLLAPASMCSVVLIDNLDRDTPPCRRG